MRTDFALTPTRDGVAISDQEYLEEALRIEARRAKSGTSDGMKLDKLYDGCSRAAGGPVRRSCDRR